MERPADVKQSRVEVIEESQALLEDKHSVQTRPPLGLWTERRRFLDPSPQPRLEAPWHRPHLLPTAALLPAFKLVLQTHQQLVQQIRNEGVAEDKHTSSGWRGDLTFSGIHLDNVNIFLTQSLIAWRGEPSIKTGNLLNALTKHGLWWLPKNVVRPKYARSDNSSISFLHSSHRLDPTGRWRKHTEATVTSLWQYHVI